MTFAPPAIKGCGAFLPNVPGNIPGRAGQGLLTWSASPSINGLKLAARRFGWISAHPENGFAGRVFCFVRNRFRTGLCRSKSAPDRKQEGLRDGRALNRR
jgi:hypothetical protein